jgi:hypothetical protein
MTAIKQHEQSAARRQPADQRPVQGSTVDHAHPLEVDGDNGIEITFLAIIVWHLASMP